ncbi:MAG TPA: hypothetical protein VEY91_00770 [Candidatus Limnocylindria bacterium]|nr:hypothetical protein [Candidatus Limnocylindria bacterium]
MRGAPPARVAPHAKSKRSRESRHDTIEPLRGAAFAVVLVWAALLVLAPPASNYVWAVNGLRSLPQAGVVALLLAAAGAAAIGRFRVPAAFAWALAGALALLVAFPLREAVHFLGDTQFRLRTLVGFAAELGPVAFGDWVVRLHASPLDVAVNVLLPIQLHRLGLPIRDVISLVGALLGFVYFASWWRAVPRLGAPPDTRVPFALALALTGTLEAFAGYAESAALVAAAGAWWWSELIGPLARPRHAVRLCAAWLVLVLAHRLGIVMALPMIWRALAPPMSGDRPEARRWFWILLAGAMIAAAGVMFVGGIGDQLVKDAAELLRTARRSGLRTVPLSDVANTLLLVAPLAILAPWLAGRRALAAFVRHPVALLVTLAAVPLLLGLVWLFLVGDSNLGAHRDWDINILLGLALTLAAGQVLALAPPERVRGRLIWILPLLVIGAGGWVAVNAHSERAMERAIALATDPPKLPGPQQSHAHLFIGQRAMDLGEFDAAGVAYEHAFALNPNPRRALLAAEAWLVAGDVAAARRSLARARALELSPTLTESARVLDEAITRLEAQAAGDTATVATP